MVSYKYRKEAITSLQQKNQNISDFQLPRQSYYWSYNIYLSCYECIDVFDHNNKTHLTHSCAPIWVVSNLLGTSELRIDVFDQTITNFPGFSTFILLGFVDVFAKFKIS
jgi:hypothetical protein